MVCLNILNIFTYNFWTNMERMIDTLINFFIYDIFTITFTIHVRLSQGKGCKIVKPKMLRYHSDLERSIY